MEVISICLPSSMHAEYGARALRAGMHVLVEKPVDITPEAAMLLEEYRNCKIGQITLERVEDNA